MTVQLGVLIVVLEAAHLGPRVVQAQGDHGEQPVDDEHREKVAALTLEGEAALGREEFHAQGVGDRR